MQAFLLARPPLNASPGLVAGDALHVCLNVVAVLFLCEVDNAMYMVALNERVRARVEDAGGAPKLLSTARTI